MCRLEGPIKKKAKLFARMLLLVEAVFNRNGCCTSIMQQRCSKSRYWSCISFNRLTLKPRLVTRWLRLHRNSLLRVLSPWIQLSTNRWHLLTDRLCPASLCVHEFQPCLKLHCTASVNETTSRKVRSKFNLVHFRLNLAFLGLPGKTPKSTYPENVIRKVYWA